MSYRRTFFFFIIFAALALFFYTYEFRGGATRREAGHRAQSLFPFKIEDVTALSLQKSDQLITAEKEDGTWEIRQPVSAPAEQRTINRILETLQELKYVRDIGSPDNLEPFGLSEPEVEIEISGPQGTIGTLVLGATTPEGTNIYVKKAAGGKVFTVPKSTKQNIDRSLFDLRDKTVFDFSVPDVRGLTIRRNGRILTFENRPEDGWTMISPAEYSANTEEITTLLDSIKYARIKEFVEEEVADAEKYGLEHPLSDVELTLAEGTKKLSFGKTPNAEPEHVYARRNDQSQVLKLDDEILKKLSVEVSDWRSRRLAKFEQAKVRRLQVDSATGRIAVERDPEEPGLWRLIEPEQDIADRDKMIKLFSDVQNARITRFLTADGQKTIEPAFDTPLIRLSMDVEDFESPLTLLLAESANQTELYARMKENGEIFEVERGLLEKLTLEPNEMRDKSVIRFEEADIERIEVSTQEKTFALTRKDVKWSVPGDLELESYEIDQFMWDLRKLKYITLEPEKRNVDYGFSHPTLTVKLWKRDEEAPLELEVGAEAPDRNSYYLRRSDDTRIMNVEGMLVSEWLDTF